MGIWFGICIYICFQHGVNGSDDTYNGGGGGDEEEVWYSKQSKREEKVPLGVVNGKICELIWSDGCDTWFMVRDLVEIK